MASVWAHSLQIGAKGFLSVADNNNMLNFFENAFAANKKAIVALVAVGALIGIVIAMIVTIAIMNNISAEHFMTPEIQQGVRPIGPPCD